MIRNTLLLAVLALLLATPAGAFMKCKVWEGLDDGQKEQALLDQIDRVVTSNDAKKYGSINKVTVRKCLESRVPDIRDQFDGICMDGKTASMQALNRELERYVWTCVGRRHP